MAHALCVGCPVENGEVLAAQDQPYRSVVVDRHPPCHCRLVCVTGSDEAQARHRPERGELFDGLVGRTILADPDRVVTPRVDDVRPTEGGEADGRAHVVGEDEERASDGQHATVQRHAVHGGTHGVLTHPVIEHAPLAVGAAERRMATDRHPGVSGQVGAADHKTGNLVHDGVEAVLRCHTCCHLCPGFPHRQGFIPTR